MSLRDHLLVCDHQVAWDDSNYFRMSPTHLELKETLFMKRDKLTRNKKQIYQELL